MYKCKNIPDLWGFPTLGLFAEVFDAVPVDLSYFRIISWPRGCFLDAPL